MELSGSRELTESIKLLRGSWLGAVFIVFIPLPLTEFQSPPFRMLSNGDPMELFVMIWPALLLPELPVIPVIIEPLAIPGDTDVWVIDKSSQITNVKKTYCSCRAGRKGTRTGPDPSWAWWVRSRYPVTSLWPSWSRGRRFLGRRHPPS